MQRYAMISLILAIVSNLGGIAEAQVPAIPPHIFVFEKYDENLATLTVTQTSIHNVPVTLTRVNAAGVEETETTLVPEYRDSRHTHLLAETTLRTMAGKELDRKEIAPKLKKGQAVVLVAKGQKLADSFQALFRDDVIVMEVKALGTDPALDPKPDRPKK